MNSFTQQAGSMDEGMVRTVMSGFCPKRIPVYSALVDVISVFDRWFASIQGYAVLLIDMKDREGQAQVLSAVLDVAEDGTQDIVSRFRSLIAIGSLVSFSYYKVEGYLIMWMIPELYFQLMLDGLVKSIAIDFDVQAIAKAAKASQEAEIAQISDKQVGCADVYFMPASSGLMPRLITCHVHVTVKRYSKFYYVAVLLTFYCFHGGDSEGEQIDHSFSGLCEMLDEVAVVRALGEVPSPCFVVAPGKGRE
ncbi:hypothetical protein Taro_021222, partial [Colocasia esculenta]|nr:hypothetical protein [Colocasia esculenta]